FLLPQMFEKQEAASKRPLSCVRVKAMSRPIPQGRRPRHSWTLEARKRAVGCAGWPSVKN
ncbi:MAG TPA: hypothetical protein VGR64_04990, partial [Terracidiphilus sp.]|nr:hypothetical protein [Terracidiphilus sp.]